MREFIKNLSNLKVDKIIAGGSNGSIVLMDISNESTKYVIYIYCSWRLSLENEVITTWNDESISSDSIFVVQMKKLEGDTIESVHMHILGDLELTFESGKRLNIFSDISSNSVESDNVENWSLCNVITNKCYSLNNYFKIVEEIYDSNQ